MTCIYSLTFNAVEAVKTSATLSYSSSTSVLVTADNKLIGRTHSRIVCLKINNDVYTSEIGAPACMKDVLIRLAGIPVPSPRSRFNNW